MLELSDSGSRFTLYTIPLSPFPLTVAAALIALASRATFIGVRVSPRAESQAPRPTWVVDSGAPISRIARYGVPAETTPGPLILVTEFVALLAGFAQSGLSGAVAAGMVALWVTFTPCFLWIFLAGPYLERISAQPRLAGALKAITAAVVGVIANLSIWFALHVLFDIVQPDALLAIPLPVWSSFNVSAAALTILAAALMLALKRGFVSTMSLCAFAALLLSVN